jgi:omega-6 fatty acid desaturase (delta-12 desaturase)
VLFVVPCLLFVEIIGWTVYLHHVAPDTRWWTRREWTQFNGQMESTTIIRVPRVVNRLWFHDIFVHVPHHVDTRIPFHELLRAGVAIAAAYRTRCAPHGCRCAREAFADIPAV